ncbi:low molecular weight protein arginine phosphatase [Ruminiclostridium herbifermentans]|uniref:Low molecular weight protein arginine phosphatase n=1 Tax=Ruminiclostridium herbifermentans TaxID=2488810 RepID=A0A4U7JK96_9FIRM|nr:low molecular weight protein arginine phosphatase [Ruminiclostridium herbifermentans]QNU66676.1 low molecular weight protein arginine phosphatase [Ruminiclostridium herbifermentans]
MNNDKKDINVIFVCTGNTCRSCMAEGIFRAVASEEEGKVNFKAISRGIYAFDGDSASEHSINALKNLWDIDISLHKAKMLSPQDVLQGDLLLTMTRAHRDIIKTKFPDMSSKIFTLKEYVYPNIEKDSYSIDISDPYGLQYSIYENCAKEIYECVKAVIKKLA